MHAMTQRVGHEHGVNPDDLQQELLEQLLLRPELDLERLGWRAWITQRAHWRASDMLRREKRAALDYGVPDDLLGESPEPVRLDVDADVRRLRAMGLNGDEIRIIGYLIWGFGKSAAEFADLVGVSAAKVRQDKRRGLRKILGFAALSPAEQQAVAAGMRAPSRAAAARRLGVTEKVFTDRLREAAQKIGAAYDDAGWEAPRD